MKKQKTTLFLILFLCLSVFVFPYLLDLKFIGVYVEKKIRENYAVNIRIGKTSWEWFPTPNLSVKKTTAETDFLHVSIDDIDIFPDFSSLLRGSLSISNLVIDTPTVRIKSLESLDAFIKHQPEKKEPMAIQPLAITLKNGSVELPFDGFLKGLEGKTDPVHLTAIDLTLNVSPNQTAVAGSLTPPHVSHLSSEIDIHTPDGSLNDPFLNMKIKAAGMDLSKIRKTLLTLFGDNDIIQEVCGDIVLAGNASEAEFLYTGKASELDELDNMTITATADAVDIHIPDTNIFLKNTKGAIRIKDSVLTGTGLSSSLKNSFGTNGTLLLGLGETDNRFNVSVDIDADLSELHDVIDEFIDRPDIKRELSGIRNLKGRTAATLTLGDTLDNIDVYVNAPSLSGTCYYVLLNRTIRVHKGQLSITPESVSWKNLACDIGPNTITGSTGSVHWKDEPLLDIKQLKASLDASDVYEGVCQWPKLKNTITPVLTGIDGEVQIEELSLNGPVKRPDTFIYKVELNSGTLSLHSPMLPGQAVYSIESATISNEEIRIKNCRTDIGDESLTLSTRLNHRVWQGINGSVVLNGTAGKALAPWLKEKGWIPKQLFPELPCALSPLTVTLNYDAISINGNIHHRDRYKTSVDATVKKDAIVVKSLNITSGKETAAFSVKYPETPGNKTVSASFKGKLSNTTVTSILEYGRRVNADLEGDFNIKYSVDQKEATHLSGPAEIKNLKANLRNNGSLSIGHLEINGESDWAGFNMETLTVTRPDHLKDKMTEQLVVPELKGGIYFLPGGGNLLKIVSGNLCGIQAAGEMSLPSKQLDFSLSTMADTSLTFEELFDCLGITQTKITGNITLRSNLKGTPKTISDGEIIFRATDGVVENAQLLTKILALIDLTELFSNNPIKNLMTSGYRYDVIEIDAEITGHNAHITRAVIIGAGLNLYGNGHIDLETMSFDMVVMASPFKAVDSIITSLPVIGRLVGGKNKSVLSVPIKIEGNIGNPRTRFLPKRLSKVSSGILDTFVNTFKVPFEFSYKLINPDSNTDKNQDTHPD